MCVLIHYWQKHLGRCDFYDFSTRKWNSRFLLLNSISSTQIFYFFSLVTLFFLFSKEIEEKRNFGCCVAFCCCFKEFCVSSKIFVRCWKIEGAVKWHYVRVICVRECVRERVCGVCEYTGFKWWDECDDCTCVDAIEGEIMNDQLNVNKRNRTTTSDECVRKSERVSEWVRPSANERMTMFSLIYVYIFELVAAIIVCMWAIDGKLPLKCFLVLMHAKINQMLIGNMDDFIRQSNTHSHSYAQLLTSNWKDFCHVDSSCDIQNFRYSIELNVSTQFSFNSMLNYALNFIQRNSPNAEINQS